MWVVDNNFNNNNLYAYILPQSSTNSPTASSDDPGLIAMALSGVELNPVFSSHNSIYMATVAHAVTSTTITVTPSYSEITVNISPASSNAGGVGGSSGGHQVPLKEGLNITTVDVTVENGSTRTYAVFITRETATQSSSRGALGQGEEAQSTARSFQPLVDEVVSHLDLANSLTATAGSGWKSRLISAESLLDGGVRFVFLVSAEEFKIKERSDLLSGEWRLLTEDEFKATRESNVDGQDRLTLILPQVEGEQRFLRLIPQR